LNSAENRGVGANRERQGEDRRRGEARRPAEQPNGVAEVMAKSLEDRGHGALDGGKLVHVYIAKIAKIVKIQRAHDGTTEPRDALDGFNLGNLGNFGNLGNDLPDVARSAKEPA
jgi:hypothetical protein